MKKLWITCLTVAAVLAVALVLYLIGMSGGDTVSVSVNGTEYATASLDEETIIEVTDGNGKVINRVVVENGAVRMAYADCPDQICVHTGTVKAGQIVCLPHRVIVTVTGEKQ